MRESASAAVTRSSQPKYNNAAPKAAPTHRSPNLSSAAKISKAAA